MHDVTYNTLTASLGIALFQNGFVQMIHGETGVSTFDRGSQKINLEAVEWQGQSGTIANLESHTGFFARLDDDTYATSPSASGAVTIWRKADLANLSAGFLRTEIGCRITEPGAAGDTPSGKMLE